jgi:hypothetical protein
VRHTRDDDLDQLEPLLVQLRQLPALKENKRGNFYRGSRAFLHFHADPSGLYADIRLAEDFERFRVTTRREQQQLLARATHALASR